MKWKFNSENGAHLSIPTFVSVFTVDTHQTSTNARANARVAASKNTENLGRVKVNWNCKWFEEPQTTPPGEENKSRSRTSYLCTAHGQVCLRHRASQRRNWITLCSLSRSCVSRAVHTKPPATCTTPGLSGSLAAPPGLFLAQNVAWDTRVRESLLHRGTEDSHCTHD